MVLIIDKIIYISCGPQKTSVNCMMGLNDFHSVDVLGYESVVPVQIPLDARVQLRTWAVRFWPL